MLNPASTTDSEVEPAISLAMDLEVDSLSLYLNVLAGVEASVRRSLSIWPLRRNVQIERIPQSLFAGDGYPRSFGRK